MSLSRFALRVATAQALKGATLAGAKVFDSAIDPIDVQARAAREPFIVVLTDEHSRTPSGGRDMRHGTDACELVIEVAVATKATAQDGTEEVIIPHTDAGMEFTLDLTCHQIGEALMGGTGAWSKLWRKFAFTVTQIVARRGASAETGVRFAARQIVVSCNILSDPVRGEPMPAAWTELLAAMDADAELAGLSGVVRFAIEGDVLMTPEALVASTFGIAESAVDAMGLTPIRDLAGEPVLVEEVITDNTPPPDWSLTEAAADDAGA